MTYIVFNSSNGEILRTGVCPGDMLEIQAGLGESALEGVADDTFHYIQGETITPKAELTCSINATQITRPAPIIISGLPIPAVVRVGNQRYEVPDGTAEISVNLPGTYKIICKAMHCLPREFTVEVI